MPLSDEEVDLRRAVWSALSELYLDTEPPWEAVAATCAASPFSLDALRRILFDEVDPVLRFNMSSVAGVWQGFDEAWLVAAIRARRRRPWPRLAWFEERRYPWRELRPLVVAKRRPDVP
ncbi:DUF7079 family protein [Coralloluteibacterium stylophorae]|uniref:DUF7079 domain-containing protein n=1 Tax=Coralloluteibacterium stylophorae TaxID=1776034 RepID=A0A8J7VQ28_9GAMM|nr:hypothetical protein [Coralloluteibacterium stylophorae]MBS7457288.1 hypothetical protein [Coralloluteibacterium stylophorae]